MNYDYEAFKKKNGKELEKMQKSLIVIAKYDPKDPTGDPKPKIVHVRWVINDKLYHNYKIHRTLTQKNGSAVYYSSLENIFEADEKKSRVEIKVWKYDFNKRHGDGEEILICSRSEQMNQISIKADARLYYGSSSNISNFVSVNDKQLIVPQKNA